VLIAADWVVLVSWEGKFVAVDVSREAMRAAPAYEGTDRLDREPLVVLTSNVFAILGLRLLYFLLGGAVDRFHLLRYGLALALTFVGLKMVWLDGWYGGKFPIVLSLTIITGVIGGAVLLSVVFPLRGNRVASRSGRVQPSPGG
jgi:predicted tellurium resistance membrane protein TerC